MSALTQGADLRKDELYTDTQRDRRDYIGCIIDSDQPSNWGGLMHFFQTLIFPSEI